MSEPSPLYCVFALDGTPDRKSWEKTKTFILLGLLYGLAVSGIIVLIDSAVAYTDALMTEADFTTMMWYGSITILIGGIGIIVELINSYYCRTRTEVGNMLYDQPFNLFTKFLMVIIGGVLIFVVEVLIIGYWFGIDLLVFW